MNYSKQNGQTFNIITKTAIHNVYIGTILYFECNGTLIKVFHTGSEEPYCCTNTLKKLETEFAEFGFTRIIHNRLVNMKHVVFSDTKTHELHMKNGQILPISRRKWHKLKAFYNI